MKQLQRILNGVALSILLVLGFLYLSPTARVIAQAAFMRGMVSGATRGWAVPAYLKLFHGTATTVYTTVHTGPTVLGCVVIGVAGAAGSTIDLYNSASVVSANKILTIDATKVGSQFCYGVLFSGMLGVVVTSSGAAPDYIISFQGQ